MTFSNIRVKGLGSLHKPVIAIGPYIHYAECMLNSEEMNSLKKELGKTLLFFPTHTCCEGGLEYEIHCMIDELLELKEKLGKKGHVFVSDTDTEVIAHLIEEYRQNQQIHWFLFLHHLVYHLKLMIPLFRFCH